MNATISGRKTFFMAGSTVTPPAPATSLFFAMPSAASVRFRRFNQSVRQFPVAVHGAAQQNVITIGFVKEDMLLKRKKDDDEPPVAQTRMRKSGDRAKQRMLNAQLTGGFGGGEIAFGDFPVGVDRIPFKLA